MSLSSIELDLQTKLRKKQHCAIWLQSCSRTHALWCDCGLWTSHIRGWRPTHATDDENDGLVTVKIGGEPTIKIDAFGNLVDTVKEDNEG
nr:ORF2 [Torque teno felis virus]QYD01889.1 ORF2 [Torque teno felis virus]